MYLVIFGTKRPQVMLVDSPASALKNLAGQGLSILVAKANLSMITLKLYKIKKKTYLLQFLQF